MESYCTLPPKRFGRFNCQAMQYLRCYFKVTSDYRVKNAPVYSFLWLVPALHYKGSFLSVLPFCGELSSPSEHVSCVLSSACLCLSSSFLFVHSSIHSFIMKVLQSRGIAQVQVSRFTLICCLMSFCFHWKTPVCCR